MLVNRRRDLLMTLPITCGYAGTHQRQDRLVHPGR
jgi:hypothetical protein